MANFIGFGRSNFIKVKDEEKFKELYDEWANWFKLVEKEENGQKVFALISVQEQGDYPEYTPDDERIDFLGMVSEHLVEEDGNIFVWIQAGSEAERYASGFAEAVDHTGKNFGFSLMDIYRQCKEELGAEPISIVR